MFGRTGPRRPEDVGLQRDIYWSVGSSLWCVATLKSSLGIAQHSLSWGHGLYTALRNLHATIIYLCKYFLNGKFMWGPRPHIFTNSAWSGLSPTLPKRPAVCLQDSSGLCEFHNRVLGRLGPDVPSTYVDSNAKKTPWSTGNCRRQISVEEFINSGIIRKKTTCGRARMGVLACGLSRLSK